MRKLLILIVFLIPNFAIAAGPFNPFTVGNWQGGAWTDVQTGEFTHCAAQTSYNSGVTFFVSINKDLQWNIALSNNNWTLVPKQQIPIKLIFDNKNNFDVFSVSQSNNMIIASMPSSSTIINIFKQSQFMDVFVKGDFYKFKLDGTSKLLPTIEDCVNNSKKYVRSPPVNNAIAENYNVNVASPQHEIEALKMATNFLLRAQVSGAKIVDKKELPITFASYNAAWKSDDLLGGVKILAVDPSVKGIEVAAKIVSDDAKDCKGKFNSGRVSELVDSDVVFRGFSTCEDSMGSRISQYFVVPRSNNGFVVFFVNANIGKTKETSINKEEQLSNLRKAALVSISD